MKNILSQNEKQEIRAKIPDLAKSTILSEAVIRLWTAPPGGTEWGYSGLWGAILLIVERQTGVKTLKLFDLKTFDVVFQEELNSGMNYCADVVGFHTFEIENMLVAFEFCVSNDANKHAQMVLSVMPVDKSATPVPVPAQQVNRRTSQQKAKKKKKKRKKPKWTFFKSDDSASGGGGISGPTGFKHVGGYNMKPGEVSENLPSEMTNLFEQAGVTREMLINDPGLAAEVLKLVNTELSGVQSPPRKDSGSLARPAPSPVPMSRSPPSIGRGISPSPTKSGPPSIGRASPVSLRRGPPPGRSPATLDRQPPAAAGPPPVGRPSPAASQRAVRGSPPSIRRGAPPSIRRGAPPGAQIPGPPPQLPGPPARQISSLSDHPAIPDVPTTPLRTGGPPRKPPSPQYEAEAPPPSTPAPALPKEMAPAAPGEIPSFEPPTAPPSELPARPPTLPPAAGARPPPLAAAPPLMAAVPPPPVPIAAEDFSSPAETKSTPAGARSALLAAIQGGPSLKKIEGTARPEPTRLRTERISLLSDNAKDNMLAKLKDLVEQRRGMVRESNLSSSDEDGSDWE